MPSVSSGISVSSLACSNPAARFCLHFHYSIAKSKMKDSCVLGDHTARHQRGQAFAFIWSFLQLSLYLISGFSVCFHMPPRFHNRAALCCSITCQHLSYQHMWLEGATRLLRLDNLFRHAKTQTAARSLSPSDGIGLDLHGTKTLKSQTSIRTRQNSV